MCVCVCVWKGREGEKGEFFFKKAVPFYFLPTENSGTNLIQYSGFK